MTEVVSHRKTLRDRFFKSLSPKLVGDETTNKIQWQKFPQFIAYRLFRLSGELTAIVLGVACLWFGALNSLMARQSVDITGLKPNAQMWFSQAFNGSDAQIGDMSLSWLSASNTILFEATDVLVTHENGAKIETIPRLQTEIPMRSASKGNMMPQRVIIDGGTVTWLRSNSGSIVAGLGTPNTVGKLGPVWRGVSQKPNQRTDISSVETVTITNATAYIIDDADGLELTLRDTDIDFSQTIAGVEIDLTSNIQKEAVNIPLKLKFKTSSDLKDYTVDIVTSGLNPSFFSPKRGRYSGLKGFDSALDIRANLQVDREFGLQIADVDIKAGQGNVKFGEFETDFDSANLAALLSAESQDMEITSIGLSSNKVSFSGAGTLSELGAMTDGNINSSPIFDLAFEDVRIDRTPSLPAPFNFLNMDLSGRLDLDARRLELDRLQVNLGHYEYDLAGSLVQNEDGDWNNITLKGRANGTLTPNDLLSIWPINFAKGARDWIERSVLRASLKNLIFDAVFDENALRTGIPQNEDLTLTFDITDADVKYISTMTPYTNVSGKGILRGNSARFDAVGGNIGSLKLTQAVADIPRLQPKGGDLNISLNGNGTTADMLTLIDQKPFEYPSQFGVIPTSFGGMGEIDMTIKRPLLVYFDRNRIEYKVSGKFTDVTAPIGLGSNKMKNGHVTMTADKNGMTIKGPVDIGPWKTDLNWRKEFDFGKTPIRYQVIGNMDRDTLDGFGIGFREYFEGDIAVKLDALGNGLDLTSAEISADLTDTAIQFGDYWGKSKGSPGAFKGQLKRQIDGAIQFEKMKINAPGLDVAGRVAFAENFKLVEMDLSTTKVLGLIDAAVKMKPDELNEKLSVFVTGDYLDVSDFVSNALSTGQGGIDVPILLTAALKKLALKENYIVDDANVLFSHNGVGITNSRLAAQTNDGELKLQMRSYEEGQPRKIDVNIPDASVAASAFLGLDSIEGGRLQIAAELPPIGQSGALMGVAEIDKFKLIRAPILAQMLSIGSLIGMVDTLSGEGLSFNTFYVPFAYREGELNIRNARVSGPALGMTGDGEIRFKDRLVDIDGTLVPAYTANSLLGDIPVLGSILVGKKGEGIFALSYIVQGDFGKAQVAVNPLSALTPGFLRGIFKPKRDKLPDDVMAEIMAVKPN